ncbi:MAG: hypothetical protein DLM56_12005 [Pseudonocardiales bacterium]|nr:MAG: hypothetical protein DLM56_12005 [Pseudonocardiales bacterium]
MAITGLAAVAVAGVVVYIDGPGPGEQSASAAATPPLLATGAPDMPGSAAAVLGAIIDRTRSLPAGPAKSGYRHFSLDTWALTTRINNQQVTSAVIPEHREVWIAPDGSGREVRHYLTPIFASSAAKQAWQRQGMPGSDTRTDTVTSPSFSLIWPQAAPTDPAALAKWLTRGHPVANGPAETIAAVTDLVKEQVLDPQQRAALLRVISKLPSLTYRGPVNDRAGRPGELFSLDSNYSGLPTRYELIVDKVDGRILGSDEVLPTTPGKLGVKIPAVIDYETYLQADITSSNH